MYIYIYMHLYIRDLGGAPRNLAPRNHLFGVDFSIGDETTYGCQRAAGGRGSGISIYLYIYRSLSLSLK